jgi:hypothetical protein
VASFLHTATQLRTLPETHPARWLEPLYRENPHPETEILFVVCALYPEDINGVVRVVPAIALHPSLVVTTRMVDKSIETRERAMALFGAIHNKEFVDGIPRTWPYVICDKEMASGILRLMLDDLLEFVYKVPGPYLGLEWFQPSRYPYYFFSNKPRFFRSFYPRALTHVANLRQRMFDVIEQFLVGLSSLVVYHEDSLFFFSVALPGRSQHSVIDRSPVPCLTRWSYVTIDPSYPNALSLPPHDYGTRHRVPTEEPLAAMVAHIYAALQMVQAIHSQPQPRLQLAEQTAQAIPNQPRPRLQLVVVDAPVCGSDRRGKPSMPLMVGAACGTALPDGREPHPMPQIAARDYQEVDHQDVERKRSATEFTDRYDDSPRPVAEIHGTLERGTWNVYYW